MATRRKVGSTKVQAHPASALKLSGKEKTEQLVHILRGDSRAIVRNDYVGAGRAEKDLARAVVHSAQPIDAVIHQINEYRIQTRALIKYTELSKRVGRN